MNNAGNLDLCRLISRDLKRWGIIPVTDSNNTVWFAEEVQGSYSVGGLVAHYPSFRLLFPVGEHSITSVLYSRIQNSREEVKARSRSILQAQQKKADAEVEAALHDLTDELMFAVNGPKYFTGRG